MMPVLSTGRVKIIDSTGREFYVKVLFDSGAEINLISERCMKQFNLKRETRTVQIHGITGNILSHGIVNVQIVPWFDKHNERLLCRTFVIVKDIPVTRRTDFSGEIAEFNGLLKADPRFNVAEKIDMLIGVSVWSKIIEQEIVQSTSGLCAQKTAFGYAIFGEIEPTYQINLNMISVNFMFEGEDMEEEKLEEVLKRFWEMTDVVDDESPLSVGEIRAEEIYKNSVRRSPEGKYIVQIPFIEEEKELGDSKATTLQRYYELEARLRRTGLRERYNKFMNEYIELGHMRAASEGEKRAGGYYIPQHVVTKKFRVVFDGSSTTTNGKSVNDIQLAGPNLQDKLSHVIMRWRTHQFVLTTDVKKMFRQILVDQKDLIYQKIFF